MVTSKISVIPREGLVGKSRWNMTWHERYSAEVYDIAYKMWEEDGRKYPGDSLRYFYAAERYVQLHRTSYVIALQEAASKFKEAA